MIHYGFWSNYLMMIGLFFVITYETYVFFKLWKGKGALKTVLGNALILLCILWACFIPLETYYRFAYGKTEAFDPLIMSHLRGSAYVRVDSREFRGREHQPKQEGTYRIGVIGDSFTEGQAIRNLEDRLSNLLEKQLRARFGPNVEVYNCGKGGWETGHHLDFLTGYQDYYQFDEVILAYFMNDIADLVPIGDWPVQPKVPDNTFLRRFYFPNHLYGVLRFKAKTRHLRYSDFIFHCYSEESRWLE